LGLALGSSAIGQQNSPMLRRLNAAQKSFFDSRALEEAAQLSQGPEVRLPIWISARGGAGQHQQLEESRRAFVPDTGRIQTIR